MPLYLEKALYLLLTSDGIIVYKNIRLEALKLFSLWDYLIQDHGQQPDWWFGGSNKARVNHAFWMIFKKVT